MTLKTVKTCTMCGSASIGPDGECFNCHHKPGRDCDACAYKLDERGQCARCANVLPEDLEAMKFVTVTWTVCSVHGARDARGKETHYRAEWKTPDPRDRRKKIRHSEWRHRCFPCALDINRFFDAADAKTFSEKIMIPAEVYQKLIDERLRKWKERK
jgi:hypothetical protein